MTPTSKDAAFVHPDDGFYMIEPAGDHLDREGRVIQVIDPDAIVSIVENFNAAAQAENFPGMVIDHEHFKHDLDKDTIAYGWLMGLQARADGIYGRIRWTTMGQKAVDGGEYRWFSTEYDLADMEVLSDGEPRRVRPLKLAGLTLTNSPNNKGGKPITNRGGAEPVGPANPEGACRAFGMLVNRKRAALNCSFDHAWRLASVENPALFAAMGAAGAPVLNRGAGNSVAGGVTEGQVKSANGRLLMLARDRADGFKVRFEQAWDEVQREFPDLRARASGRVVNRAEFYIKPDDQREADKRAPDVLWDLRQAKQDVPDRGNTIAPSALKCAFLSSLRLLQEKSKAQKESMSLEEAFAYLRENEPVFWARGVLSYELEKDAAVPFEDFGADRRRQQGDL